VIIIVFLRHIQLIFSSYSKTKKIEKCFMGCNEFRSISRQIGPLLPRVIFAENEHFYGYIRGTSGVSRRHVRPFLLQPTLVDGFESQM